MGNGVCYIFQQLYDSSIFTLLFSKPFLSTLYHRLRLSLSSSSVARFAGGGASASMRLLNLASMDDDARRDLYRKMDMLLEELALHNAQLKEVVQVRCLLSSVSEDPSSVAPNQ